jgi:hypothetical protein
MKRQGWELKWLGARLAASISKCWCSLETGFSKKGPLVVLRFRSTSKNSISTAYREQITQQAYHAQGGMEPGAGPGFRKKGQAGYG